MGVKGVMQRVLPGRRRRSADAAQDLSDAAPSTPPAEAEAPASPLSQQRAVDKKFSPGSGVAGVGHEAALTVGCFDVFHRGHKTLIDRLRGMGDVISVGCVARDAEPCACRERPPAPPVRKRRAGSVILTCQCPN